MKSQQPHENIRPLRKPRECNRETVDQVENVKDVVDETITEIFANGSLIQCR